MKKVSFYTAPVRHVLLIISVLIITLFQFLKKNVKLMERIAEKVIKPLRMTFSFMTSVVSFSVAEILIAMAAAGLIIYIISVIVKLIRLKFRKNRGRNELVYKLFLTLVTVVAGIYAGFCVLWGVYYYGDSFVERSGLKKNTVSVEQLSEVTGYFADLANEYSGKVNRDLQGLCVMDRKAVLARSQEVYKNLEKKYPDLIAPAVPAKGIVCSRVMSYLNFTGFFFPFTGEANVNMDSPSCMLPATAAHELAHCRGIAGEQEANFLAVLACLGYGDNEYIYSAALMAYSYLSDSLYSADYNVWTEITARLNNSVRRDLSADDFYWSKYRTSVAEVSDAVYEGFLQSYDQKLGLKSYGACVDLLVNYYYPLIESHG